MDGIQSTNGSGVAGMYAMKKAIKVQEKQVSDIIGGASAQTQSSGIQEPSRLASQSTGKGQSLDLRG